jgi:hypothetical protein
VIKRLPSLKISLGQRRKSKRKSFGSCGVTERLSNHSKSSQARIYDRPAKTCFAKRAAEGGREQKEEEAKGWTDYLSYVDRERWDFEVISV